MQGSQRTAILGVLVMMIAAIGPATAAAAVDPGADGASALDGDVDFSVTPDDDNESDDDNETENETEDDADNETDDNESETDGPNENASSTAEAMDAFVANLQQVVANATNNSSVQAPGQVIASYVVQNNPGNAPAHAGPPNSTGNASDAENGTQGPPEHAGNGNETNASDGSGPDAPGNEDDSTDEEEAVVATGDVFALRGADSAWFTAVPFGWV